MKQDLQKNLWATADKLLFPKEEFNPELKYQK